VIARSGGKVVARTTVRQLAPEQPFVVPLHARGGDCAVTLDVSQSKIPGAGDDRRLGIRVLATPVYTPRA
jgi:hypothetical protein